MNTQLNTPRPTTRRSFLGLCALLVAGLAALVGVASSIAMAPEPDPIPRRWELTFEPGALRYASVQTPEGAKSYFYMTYKVTNTSGSDMLFTPSFDLANDKGQVFRSGRDVPAAVTKELLDRLNNRFLEDQISIVGMLLQGEGNAKEGLVVWPAQTLRQCTLDVYAAGFSGETKTTEFRDPSGKVQKATLRKTLMMSFQSPGEIQEPGAKPFPMTEKHWVMR